MFLLHAYQIKKKVNQILSYLITTRLARPTAHVGSSAHSFPAFLVYLPQEEEKLSCFSSRESPPWLTFPIQENDHNAYLLRAASLGLYPFHGTPGRITTGLQQ